MSTSSGGYNQDDDRLYRGNHRSYSNDHWRRQQQQQQQQQERHGSDESDDVKHMPEETKEQEETTTTSSEARDRFPTTFERPFPASPTPTVRTSGKRSRSNDRLVVMPTSQSLAQVAAVMEHLEQDPHHAAEPSAAGGAPSSLSSVSSPPPPPPPTSWTRRAGSAAPTSHPPTTITPRPSPSLLRRPSNTSNWFSVFWAQSSLGATTTNNTAHSQTLDISEGPSAYDLYGRADRPPPAAEEDDASSKYTIQSNLDYRGLRRKRRRNIICTFLFVLLVLLGLVIVVSLVFGSSEKNNNSSSNNNRQTTDEQNNNQEAEDKGDGENWRFDQPSDDGHGSGAGLQFPAATLSPSPRPSVVSEEATSFFSCPVCHDAPSSAASFLPNPHQLVFPRSDPPSNVTCADLQAYLTYQLANKRGMTLQQRRDECQEWQIVATLRCGCTFPHPASHCTICSSGLPDEDVLQRSTGIASRRDPNEMVTCEDLIYDAAVTPPSSPEYCETTLLPRWAPWCSCPGYPPAVTAPETEQAGEGELQPTPPSTSPPIADSPPLLPTINDNDDNATLEDTSPPSPPLMSCPVCFDGQAVPNPDARLFPEMGSDSNTTCRTLEREMDRLLRNAASKATDPNDDADVNAAVAAECHKWQVRAGLRCGCAFPHERAYCHVCPDQRIPPAEILNRPTEVLPPSRQQRQGPVRCVDLIWSAAVVPANQGQACTHDIQPNWAPLCSCAAANNQTNTTAAANNDDDDEKDLSSSSSSSSMKMLEPPAMAPSKDDDDDEDHDEPNNDNNNNNNNMPPSMEEDLVLLDCPLCVGVDNDQLNETSFVGDNIAVFSATGQNMTCEEMRQKVPLWLSLDDAPQELCTTLQSTALAQCSCPG